MACFWQCVSRMKNNGFNMATSTDQITMELKRTKAGITNEAFALEQHEQSINLSPLAGALQTTIDLDQLLPIFGTELLKTVDYSGFIFEHNEFNISIKNGVRTNHSCEYNLAIENISLGKLTFMRRKRFNEGELETIEKFLSVLLYPLKNTLLYRQAIQSAHTDPLTGVLNRSTLQSVFHKEASLSKRQHSNLSFVMLDIDFFKAINDKHGHVAGDEALKEVTKCISQTARESDHIFRLGGEEFAILLNGTDLKGAELLAERLRKAIQSISINYETAQFCLTVSMGVTLYRQNEPLEDTMKRADKALYEAKETGRNKVVNA